MDSNCDFWDHVAIEDKINTVWYKKIIDIRIGRQNSLKREGILQYCRSMTLDNRQIHVNFLKSPFYQSMYKKNIKQEKRC